MNGHAKSRIPLWLKIAWTAWVLVWAPVYWKQYGPQNFLYFCDLGNFLIAMGLWLESRLIISWQALGMLGRGDAGGVLANAFDAALVEQRQNSRTGVMLWSDLITVMRPTGERTNVRCQVRFAERAQGPKPITPVANQKRILTKPLSNS